MTTDKWVEKQAKVYANEGFDEPDRLIQKYKETGKAEKRFEVLLDELEENKTEQGFNVLDIGCASGAISRYISKKYPNASITAIDLPEVIDKIEENNSKVSYKAHDVDGGLPSFHPPFLYDIIYMTEVIEHIPHDFNLLESCSFWMNKGGKLIISAPRECGDFCAEDNLHIRVYPGNMLQNLLQVAGFKIENSWEVNNGKGIVVLARK